MCNIIRDGITEAGLVRVQAKNLTARVICAILIKEGAPAPRVDYLTKIFLLGLSTKQAHPVVRQNGLFFYSLSLRLRRYVSIVKMSVAKLIANERISYIVIQPPPCILFQPCFQNRLRFGGNTLSRVLL